MRCILHVDMDEFFAAVEKLDNPELRGKPLLVGGSADKRGVVSTASYEARAFGCHSAMPMSKAIRLCPNAIVLPVRGKRYAEISGQVFEIFERFTPQIEPLSCDEAFLDVTNSRRIFGSGEEIAIKLKKAISDELGLIASVGVAENKFLAKLASDLRKPDGLFIVRHDNINAVLDPLEIRKLWGVGPATLKMFERYNIRKVGQLRKLGEQKAIDYFGEAGGHFWRLAGGIDGRAVITDTQAKSIGQEETFSVNVGEMSELRLVLSNQIETICRRLRRTGLKAKTITLKLRYGDFTTITRSSSLAQPSDSTAEFLRVGNEIFTTWAKKSFKSLRLLGATLSNLTGQRGSQLSLFGENQKDLKQEKVDEVVDSVVKKFGTAAIKRGSSFRNEQKE